MPETARRSQQRIEHTLWAAYVHGHRAGRAPVQWKGRLYQVLTVLLHVREHHGAMPFVALPTYMETLVVWQTLASHCLRFILLTARSGEARGAS